MAFIIRHKVTRLRGGELHCVMCLLHAVQPCTDGGNCMVYDHWCRFTFLKFSRYLLHPTQSAQFYNVKKKKNTIKKTSVKIDSVKKSTVPITL